MFNKKLKQYHKFNISLHNRHDSYTLLQYTTATVLGLTDVIYLFATHF